MQRLPTPLPGSSLLPQFTFMLSAVASALSLLLVASAFRRDATTGAQERGGWAGRGLRSRQAARGAAAERPCLCAAACAEHTTSSSRGLLFTPPCLPAAVESQTMDEEWELSPLQKTRAVVAAFPPAYYQALGVVMLLYLARFDVAFITVHASTVRPQGAPGWRQTLQRGGGRSVAAHPHAPARTMHACPRPNLCTHALHRMAVCR